jgi:hypothetical protein
VIKDRPVVVNPDALSKKLLTKRESGPVSFANGLTYM